MAHNYHAVHLVTCRMREAHTCRYCFYSRVDFSVFRPAGVTRYTDQGEIWQGGADRRLRGVGFRLYGPKTLKIFTNIIAPKGDSLARFLRKFTGFYARPQSA